MPLTVSLPLDNLTSALRRLFPGISDDRVMLVGGTIRDALLGHPPQDIDLLTTLPEEDLLRYGFRQVIGKSTQPIWFRTDHRLGTIEVTTLASFDLLQHELARRDFTVNAMAVSLDGQLYDPLNGRNDLLQRRLAACSPSCFEDDPLRLFRAFRFEADGWQLTEESTTLIASQDWSTRLAALPTERFSRELLRALAAANPVRFFERMLQFRIGRHWLPELFRMPQVPAGPPEHHPEGDLLSHSLQVLQRATDQTPDPLTRFCALFHDLGKLQTAPDQYPHHHGHDQAGAPLAVELCNRLRLPARYRRALASVNRLHTTMGLWDTLRDATRLRLAQQAQKAGITDLLPLVVQADKKPGATPSTRHWQLCLDIINLTTAELGIDQIRLHSLQPQALRDLILDRRVQALRACRADALLPT
ncbi:MAG: HD domain-containing protein [Geobacter sp.]